MDDVKLDEKAAGVEVKVVDDDNEEETGTGSSAEGEAGVGVKDTDSKTTTVMTAEHTKSVGGGGGGSGGGSSSSGSVGVGGGGMDNVGFDHSVMDEKTVEDKKENKEEEEVVEGEGGGDGGGGKKKRSNATSYEDALEICGFGGFHLRLLLLCGWAVSSDAIEVLSISFILPSATCDLSLSSQDKGVLTSIVFLGMLVGGYFWGSMADKWGRRSVLVWSLLVNSVGNVASSFSQAYWLFLACRFVSGVGWECELILPGVWSLLVNSVGNVASSFSQAYWLFLACRFVSGVGVGGSMPVIFTYFTEFQHKSKRGSMISLLATFWMGGNLVAASIAWLVIPRENISFTTSDFTYHSWRVYIALCSFPALTSAAMFVIMPESPKFLLLMGRPLDAMSVLQQVHTKNKSQRPLQMEDLVLTHDANDVPLTSQKQLDGGRSRVQQFVDGFVKLLQSTGTLFNKELRRRTIALLVINFTLAFGYYGLFLWFPELFHRIDKFGGSFCDLNPINKTEADDTKCESPSNQVFFESFLTSISNLPGNIFTFFVVERLGRKAILTSSMTLSGLSVFGLYFIKERWQNVFMSCLFGAISVCGFNMLDVLMVELFPTEVRSTAFGTQTCATRVGAIMGNLIFGALLDVHCAIPMLLVASMLIFGGVACLVLPNTTRIDIH